MRLVNCEFEGEIAIAVRWDGELYKTDYTSMLHAILAGEIALNELRHRIRARPPLTKVRILAPIPRPGKMLFVGINYASHINENPSAKTPSTPVFFAKLPTAVIGPGEPIQIPKEQSQVDYEGELALVIGRRMHRVPQAAALDYVFGYTIVNDVSARDIQFKDGQITIGKGADTFCPMGPEIVLADEIADPSDLQIETRVNGELRQSESTSHMLFGLPKLLEFLSTYVTLDPGDVVSTGTPAGVGCFRNPPVYLREGDNVSVEIGPLGMLVNPVKARYLAG